MALCAHEGGSGEEWVPWALAQGVLRQVKAHQLCEGAELASKVQRRGMLALDKVLPCVSGSSY